MFANGHWPGPNGTFEAKNIYCRMRDPLFNTWTALPVADRFGAKYETYQADPSSVKLENMIIDYRGAGEMFLIQHSFLFIMDAMTNVG